MYYQTPRKKGHDGGNFHDKTDQKPTLPSPDWPKTMRIFPRLTMILTLLALSACGFRPLYGAGAAGTDHTIRGELSTIAIAPIPDRSGVMLRNLLIDRLHTAGTPINPRYTLTVAPIIEAREDLDITVDEESTRAQLRNKTGFTLTRAGTGEVVMTRTVYALASYNILESQFTTRVAADNARANNLADLARQIEQAIVTHLANPRPSTTP